MGMGRTGMIAYVIYGKADGAVRRCGRVASRELLARLKRAADEEIATVSHADFAAAWNGWRHYYRFEERTGRLVKKRPLQLAASAFTLPADGVSTIAITTVGTTAAVEVMVNGLPQKITGGHARLAHDTPGELIIEVSQHDPAYYTDRGARPASAAGPGEPFGALVINVEAPAVTSGAEVDS